MTKLNKGAKKAIKKLKDGYKSAKRNISDGDNFKVVVDKVYRVTDLDKEFYGTASRIVFDMRFWDTGMGRCRTNKQYMEIVGGRISGFPICKDEVSFLKELERFGFVTIDLPN